MDVIVQVVGLYGLLPSIRNTHTFAGVDEPHRAADLPGLLRRSLRGLPLPRGRSGGAAGRRRHLLRRMPHL